MYIILSPSKTQDTSQFKKEDGQKLFNELASLYLFDMIKQLDKDALGDFMHIKNQLLEDTYQIYQDFNANNLQKKAIDLYTGVVFEALDIDTYNEKQRSYMNRHLIILSAMYGILKANTLIWPYRLDMTMKPAGLNLYDYWLDLIDDFFDQTDVVVNLASNEFSKMLKNHKSKMIDIVFKEERQGKLRTISYNAKKARGMMVNQMIKDQVTNIEDIKEIIVDDYRYEPSKSTKRKWVFIKSA